MHSRRRGCTDRNSVEAIQNARLRTRRRIGVRDDYRLLGLTRFVARKHPSVIRIGIISPVEFTVGTARSRADRIMEIADELER